MYTYLDAEKAVEIFLDFLELNYYHPEEILKVRLISERKQNLISSSSSSSNGATIGGSIGGAAGLLIIICILCYCCKKKRAEPPSGQVSTVFVPVKLFNQ